MTLRDKDLQDYRKYEQFLKDTEAIKPSIRQYDVYDINGNIYGGITYHPETDKIRISSDGSVTIPGKYIKSVWEALGKLLSDTE